MALSGGVVEANKLAPFNPTAAVAVAAAVDLIETHARAMEGPGIFCDIGAGDGRIVLAVSNKLPKWQCWGIEADDKFSDRFRASVDALVHAGHAIASLDGGCVNAAGGTIKVLTGDALVLLPALPCPNVIFVYLVPSGLEKVFPVLARCIDEGGLVLVNMFSLPHVKDSWLHTRISTSPGLFLHVYKQGHT
jgi:precorrin-6B methylase 2